MEENNINQQPLMVTIRCCAYNQEPYIRECLEGFVKQQTSFRFEAIVHDDASTDGTAAIIREYAEKYPNIIRPILEKENQYSKHDGSLRRIMDEHMHGKYVAFCEGDDCWTDPLKLQKQVDYMEAHPDCVLTHTDMDVKNVVTGEVLHGKWKKQKNFNLIQRDFGKRLIPMILAGIYSVTTLTVCVRRDAMEQCKREGLIPEGKEYLMGDTPLWMALASKGTVHMIPDVCACYHAIGESATHSKNYSNVISFYVSCMKMIDFTSATYNLSEIDKDKAVQEYLYFLLKDVYTDKCNYLDEVKRRILCEKKLNGINSVLFKTMHSITLLKKMLLFFIKAYRTIKHRGAFYTTKYLGKN